MGKKKRTKKEETPEEEEVVAEETPEEVAGTEPEPAEEGKEPEPAEEEEKDEGILVFGRWSTEVEIRDRGLVRYINLKSVAIPHFAGIYTRKRFWKSKYNVIERLANRLMTPGLIKGRVKGRKTSYRSGKKQKVLNIIRRSFELLHLKTNENPVQLTVRAIENSAPREDTTRISMGGISYQSSVDVAPQRRLDMALHYLALGASRRSYNTPLTIEECLSDELLAAARGQQSSFAVGKKEEKERIAFSAR